MTMTCFFLWIPFFLIRFGLLSCLNQEALRRAAHFAPMEGAEKTAYWIYQISTAALILYSPFLRVHAEGATSLGFLCYFLGLALCTAAVFSFSAPAASGLNTGGMYRYSRNPMYIAYFFCFLGIALLSRSAVFFGLLALFQISCHWIILAEERWCIAAFGGAYLNYMRTVRRYL